MAGDRRINAAGVLAGVLMLLVAAFVAMVVFRPSRPKSEPAPELSVPMERAGNLKCLVQLNRIKAAIQMYGAENGNYPGRWRHIRGE